MVDRSDRSTSGALLLAAMLLLSACAERHYHPIPYDRVALPVGTMQVDRLRQIAGISAESGEGYHVGEERFGLTLDYSLRYGEGPAGAGLRLFGYGGSYGTDSNSSNSLSYFGAGTLIESGGGFRIGSIGLSADASFGFFAEFGPYSRLYLEPDDSRFWPLVSLRYHLLYHLSSTDVLSLHYTVTIPGAHGPAVSYANGEWQAAIGASFAGGSQYVDHSDGRSLRHIALGISYDL